MAFLQVLPKKKDTTQEKITDSPISIFIDNSGSTSDRINGRPKLLHEKIIATSFLSAKDMTVVAWDTSARIIYQNKIGNINDCQSNGGTSPQCIMRDTKTKNIFERSNTIIFMTDGEIDKSDVTSFASSISQTIQTKYIICVIVCKDKINPNISVFAPFLTAKEVVFLHYDGGQQLTVLFSKGQLSHQYIVGTQPTLTSLTETKIDNNMPDIPPGYVVIGEDESTVRVYNLDQLMISSDVSENVLSLDEWKTIIQHAKINNKLSDIREKINHLRNKNILDTFTSLKSTLSYPMDHKKQSLIAEIMECQDAAQKDLLTQQLRQIIPDARIEEVINTQLINNSLGKVRTYWDQIRDILFHFEEASYNLSDITYTSNRAKRAKIIDESEIINTSMVHTDVPETYCSVHLDNGPTVLWLKAPENLEATTNDFTINFPLSRHATLQKCIKANPICGDCAPGYFAVRKVTLYNEPVDGYIPINIKDNKQYIYIQLCKILCGGKCLNHVNMLLLSMIDDCAYDWMDQCVKNYLIKELVSNIVTTDTFSEEGNKVKLIEALSKLNSDVLFSQPFFASMRLLVFSKMFTKVQDQSVIEYAKDRFRYTVIMSLLSTLLKNGYDYNKIVIEQLLYNHLCGLPIVHSEQSVKLPNIQDLSCNF